jgi:hypothetical protein
MMSRTLIQIVASTAALMMMVGGGEADVDEVKGADSDRTDAVTPHCEVVVVDMRVPNEPPSIRERMEAVDLDPPPQYGRRQSSLPPKKPSSAEDAANLRRQREWDHLEQMSSSSETNAASLRVRIEAIEVTPQKSEWESAPPQSARSHRNTIADIIASPLMQELLVMILR